MSVAVVRMAAYCACTCGWWAKRVSGPDLHVRSGTDARFRRGNSSNKSPPNGRKSRFGSAPQPHPSVTGMPTWIRLFREADEESRPCSPDEARSL